MATSSNYYLNGPSLASATAVFTNSDLTIKAPDGWYQSEGIVRRQLSGNLLPQQNCGGDFVPINISVVSTTSAGTCALPLTDFCYNVPVVPGGSVGIITVGDTVYEDYCENNLLPNGYYNATGNLSVSGANWFRVQSGIVTNIGYCNGCTNYGIEIQFGSGGAEFLNCDGTPGSAQVTAGGGPDTTYFCAIPGTITTSGGVSLFSVGPCEE